MVEKTTDSKEKDGDIIEATSIFTDDGKTFEGLMKEILLRNLNNMSNND